MENHDSALDRLTSRIIESIIRVHQNLGPGFIESVYQAALLVEFHKSDIPVEREKEIEIFYEGVLVGRHRLDLVVAGAVILELKTVEELSRAHYAQIRSYLKATGLLTGLLVNFSKEKADFRRIQSKV
ncbi:MAG: GxxExxY protein [Planctomycetaceae bacterium]|nr:GxxExxY protein [Planctomycetaceae bacterium]